jgi:hypothetical protein
MTKSKLSGRNGMHKSEPLFEVGEIAILQPPHYSAKGYWGIETVIQERFWSASSHDAFGGRRSGWSYVTDIPAPPPTNDPRDQAKTWVWCEYDLRKKYDAGDEFGVLLEALRDTACTGV